MHERTRAQDLYQRILRARAVAPGKHFVTVQQTAFSLAINTATALGTALVLGAGSYYALQGQLTVGQLLVILSYISMVYHPLEQISANISSWNDSVRACALPESDAW